MHRIPLWLKVSYSLWMVVWVWAFGVHLGAANFLWICDAANFVLLAASFFRTDPERNINWLRYPFNRSQSWVEPQVFLLLAMVGYPLLLYLPTHLALTAWARRSRRLRLLPQH